jgi:hypothetical protein
MTVKETDLDSIPSRDKCTCNKCKRPKRNVSAELEEVAPESRDTDGIYWKRKNKKTGKKKSRNSSAGNPGKVAALTAARGKL